VENQRGKENVSGGASLLQVVQERGGTLTVRGERFDKKLGLEEIIRRESGPPEWITPPKT